MTGKAGCCGTTPSTAASHSCTTDGALPRPVVISVSIWVYRALMLIWALWLASRVLRWLPCVAKQLSTGQIWKRGETKPQTGTPPPLPQ